MRKRVICLGMSLLLLVTSFSTSFTAFAKQNAKSDTQLNEETQAVISQFVENSEKNSYYDYYNHYFSAESKYVNFVTVKGADFKKADSAMVKEIDGIKAVVLDPTNEWVEYEVTVPQTGTYGILVDYYQIKHKEKDIEVTVKIDGKLPFIEAQQMRLPRIWEDDIDPAGVPEGSYFENPDVNLISDDIRPSQKEKQMWTSRELIDIRGSYPEPYQFHLTAGTHKIRFELDREAVAISNIHFGNKAESISYADYIAKFNEDDYVKTSDGKDLTIKQQAEQTFAKNNIVLYPTYDKSGSSTEPCDPAYTRLNTIGQSNWANNGDEIVWSVNAKKAGLYKFTMRARQNFNAGMNSYRTLKINGEIPFKEAEQIKFKYRQGWYMLTLGNGDKNAPQDYYVYLNEGENKLSLTGTTAEMNVVMRNIQQAVLNLNDIYRQIISVTSAEPDVYRDYTLEQQIPTLEQDLLNARDFLAETSDIVAGITGTRGSQASSIDYVTKIVGELGEDPYIIPERLSTLKTGIETLGSLIMTVSNLALEIDYFVLQPVDEATPKVGKGFFNSIVFGFQQFLYSFTIDYNMTATDGATADEADIVKVWVSTGRDQANIINRLIKDSGEKLVTSDGKKISVQLSMVDTGGTLIRATLSGKGPDCALMIGENTPMELAARGALLPLSNYKAALEDQFYDCAWIPFTYQGELYALPETQTFDVMFYRTDVFEELGIEPPETWDEFFYVMEILQNENLMIGIPEVYAANAGVSLGISTFDKFLVQKYGDRLKNMKGGAYYTDDLSKTLFTTEEAYQSFEEWVELYSKYGLDRSFDFYSRFRTGEMPLALQGYTGYNQLKTAAPELNGLWTIAPIPGTKQADGSINICETSTVTGCMMLKSARTKGIEEAASVFLSWGVRAETQAEYARELEATLGVAARYTPANKKAFAALGWTAAEAAVIKEQWDAVTVMPEIPGNYLLKRSITSAFRSVMAGKNRPRRALTIYNTSINDEIMRKRVEFGIE